MRSATVFFECCCLKNLLDKSSDYEMLLPLLVMVLKEYPSNSLIRNEAVHIIHSVCYLVTDKKIIDTSGTVEVLGALLKWNDISEEAKTTVRSLIHKIIARRDRKYITICCCCVVVVTILFYTKLT